MSTTAFSGTKWALGATMGEASPTETWKNHLTVWRMRYSNPENCNVYLINRILT